MLLLCTMCTTHSVHICMYVCYQCTVNTPVPLLLPFIGTTGVPVYMYLYL
jgi:hypothetical protein